MPKVNRNKNNAKLKPNTFTFSSSLPLSKKQHVHGTMVETWFIFPIYWTFIRTNLSFGNICSIDCWEPKHNQSSLELEMVKKRRPTTIERFWPNALLCPFAYAWIIEGILIISLWGDLCLKTWWGLVMKTSPQDIAESYFWNNSTREKCGSLPNILQGVFRLNMAGVIFKWPRSLLQKILWVLLQKGVLEK